MLKFDRREFVAAASATALATAARATAGPGFGAERYRNAVVIDAMGDIVDPDRTLPLEAPPSPRMLDDIRASGVTAISLTLSVGLSGDRMAKAIRLIAVLDEKCAAAPQALLRVRTAADLKLAKKTGRLGLIYNLQDTELLENDLGRVETLGLLGLRQIQLTYNIRNAAGDGSNEPANSGLSLFGRQLVEELERRRIVMDLSHGGQNTIAEAIARAKRPPVISHTGCRDLTDFPRNVYDRELRALADKGGVVGIYLMPFLVLKGVAHKEDLIRHLEHAVKVCGEDHVGIGSDNAISTTVIDQAYRDAKRRSFETRSKQNVAAPGEGPDSIEIIPEYNDPLRYLHLADDLARRGWPAARIEKILGANFARVYGEVWGA